MTGSNPPSPAKVELFDRLMAVKWLPEYTDAELAEHGTTRDEMMAASNAKAVRLVWVRPDLAASLEEDRRPRLRRGDDGDDAEAPVEGLSQRPAAAA